MDNYEQNFSNQDNNWNYGNQNYNAPNYYVEEPLSMGQWLVTILIMMIPCVNIIMLFVWGFGEGNKSRQNFCRAYLIVYVIVVILMFFYISLFGASLASLGGTSL